MPSFSFVGYGSSGLLAADALSNLSTAGHNVGFELITAGFMFVISAGYHLIKRGN